MSQFRVARQVRWAVEATGVTLVNDATGAAVALGYPEAAIWDFVARGEALVSIVEKVAAIASLSRDAARMRIFEAVAEWWEAGWVAPEDPRG